MNIGGIEKLTLIDFPGEIAAIVFTQACNFRCQFCYNPMLVLSASERNWPKGLGKDYIKKDHSLIPESDLFSFLKSRIGKISGVVITGGEPTLQSDLPEFIGKIKEMGFKVKLDTNGTIPEMIKMLIGNQEIGRLGKKDQEISNSQIPKFPNSQIIDYLAMDIKAPLDKYEDVVGVKVDKEKIKKSIKLIMESGIPYEFRTTLVPGLHTKDDIAKVGELIKGADKWFLQFFKSDTELINKDFEGKNKFTSKEMEEMKKIAEKYVERVEIRG